MQEYDQNKIIEQIIAFIDGRANKDDIASLKAWTTQSEQHKAYFTQIKNIYEMSGRQLNPATIHIDKALQQTLRRLMPRGNKFRLGLWLQRVAAVLFLPLLTATLYYYSQSKIETEIPVNPTWIRTSCNYL